MAGGKHEIVDHDGPKTVSEALRLFRRGGVRRSLNVRKRFAATALFAATLPAQRVPSLARMAFDIASGE